MPLMMSRTSVWRVLRFLGVTIPDDFEGGVARGGGEATRCKGELAEN